MEPASPRLSRPRKRHPAARSRRVAAIGSAAACVALTGAFAYQNLGASNSSSAPSPSSTTPVRSYDRAGSRGDDGFDRDDGFSTAPFTDPNAQVPNAQVPNAQVPNAQVPSAPNSGFGPGSAAVPGQPGGNGANTASSGS